MIALKVTLKDKFNHQLHFHVVAVNQNGNEIVKGEVVFSQY